MACRDCKWWVNARKRVYASPERTHLGDCIFEIPADHLLPDSVQTGPMYDDEGEDCPQFKERTDGD